MCGKVNAENYEEAMKMINAILVVLLVLIGGVPSILLTLSVPVMLVWKIYRKVRYGYSLYQ